MHTAFAAAAAERRRLAARAAADYSAESPTAAAAEAKSVAHNINAHLPIGSGPTLSPSLQRAAAAAAAASEVSFDYDPKVSTDVRCGG